MSTVLIVDDEAGIRQVLRDVMSDEGHEPLVAEDGLEGMAVLERESIDLVILDVLLPGMGGIDVLRRIKRDHPDTEVIVISGHATIDMAVQALKIGARDFLEKPLSLDKTVTVVRNALQLEELRQQNRELKNSLLHEDDMVGQSEGLRRVRDLISHAAASEARILIVGDNGTGKELVAREIHRLSERAAGPFVEVNCAAIPETLIESELFGHEKGAFTSAVARRRGKFELAHRGTLFLDEVADMALPAQAKILRVIQELRFERVGGERSISVNVRLISATNKDIEAEVKAGRFREDLFFRLNVVPITVPALRERPEDIEGLLRYFLDKFRRPRSEPKQLTAPAMNLLKGYDWPGNIRELKNFAERITIMSDIDELGADAVAQFLGPQVQSTDDQLLRDFEDLKLTEARDQFEQSLILRRLRQNGFNISNTAQALGITTSGLHNKMRKYEIKGRQR